MAIVKFDEGTKFETSLDLEDGEGVIFVKPPKNKMVRTIVKPVRQWTVTLVITDKRVVSIPHPPNKKNYPVESFYFKDITIAEAQEAQTKEQSARYSFFYIRVKTQKDETHLSEGAFTLQMEMNFLNIVKAYIAEDKAFRAKNSWVYSGVGITVAQSKTNESRSHAEATGASHYTEFSPDYAAMNKNAQARAAGMDFSKAKHQQLRDYIVDVINSCVEEINK